MHKLRTQKGLSLLEAVIALLITALGILGVLGAQMRTLSDAQTSLRRGQAIRLIEDLSERLHANPNSSKVLSSYVSSYTAPIKKDDYEINECMTAKCDAENLAKQDLRLWQKNLLDNWQAHIFLAPGDNKNQLGVLIAWRENESGSANQIYKDAIDATSTTSASGGTNNTVACPTGYTCHLQYIAVASRCALQKPGSNASALAYCA